MTALWLTATFLALFTGAAFGFLTASVLAAGKREDECRMCRRDVREAEYEGSSDEV